MDLFYFLFIKKMSLIEFIDITDLKTTSSAQSGSTPSKSTPLLLDVSPTIDGYDPAHHKLVLYTKDKINARIFKIETGRIGDKNKLPLYKGDNYDPLTEINDPAVQDTITAYLNTLDKRGNLGYKYVQWKDKGGRDLQPMITDVFKGKDAGNPTFYPSNNYFKVELMNRLHRVLNDKTKFFIVGTEELYNEAIASAKNSKQSGTKPSAAAKVYDPAHHVLVLGIWNINPDDYCSYNPFIVKAGVVGNVYDIPLYAPICKKLENYKANKRAIDAAVEAIGKLSRKLIIFRLYRGLIPSISFNEQNFEIDTELNKYAVQKLNELFSGDKYYLKKKDPTQEITALYNHLFNNDAYVERLLHAEKYFVRFPDNYSDNVEYVKNFNLNPNIVTSVFVNGIQNKTDVLLSVCYASNIESDSNKTVLETINTSKIVFVSLTPYIFNGSMDLSVKLDELLKDHCEIIFGRLYTINVIFTLMEKTTNYISIHDSLNQLLNDEKNFDTDWFNGLLISILNIYQNYNFSSKYNIDKYINFMKNLNKHISSRFIQGNTTIETLYNIKDLLDTTFITLKMYTESYKSNPKPIYDIKYDYDDIREAIPTHLDQLANLSYVDNPSSVIRFLFGMVIQILKNKNISQDEKNNMFKELANIPVGEYLMYAYNNVDKFNITPIIFNVSLDILIKKLKNDPTLPQDFRNTLTTWDDVLNAYNDDQLNTLVTEEKVNGFTEEIKNILSQPVEYAQVFANLQAYVQ